MNEHLKQACIVRDNAYSPYSNIKTGASIRLKNGKYYNGCNVENSSFSSICAERNALTALVASGEDRSNVESILIVNSTDKIMTPCGACRQMMVELMPSDALVICTNEVGESITMKVSELLPNSFVYPK